MKNLLISKCFSYEIVHFPLLRQSNTYRLGVKSTYFFESSKFSVVHIFRVIWTFLRVVVHQVLFFPSNIMLFLPVQLAGY